VPAPEGTTVKRGGFKKSGFKSAFTKVEGTGDTPKVVDNRPSLVNADPLESDTDDEGYEVYDPRHPTE
jgi:hypothetical protein